MTEDRVDYCIGTGYGRVNVPFADGSITEIACHARGANFIHGPEVRTVFSCAFRLRPLQERKRSKK